MTEERKKFFGGQFRGRKTITYTIVIVFSAPYGRSQKVNDQVISLQGLTDELLLRFNNLFARERNRDRILIY